MTTAISSGWCSPYFSAVGLAFTAGFVIFMIIVWLHLIKDMKKNEFWAGIVILGLLNLMLSLMTWVIFYTWYAQ